MEKETPDHVQPFIIALSICLLAWSELWGALIVYIILTIAIEWAVRRRKKA